MTVLVINRASRFALVVGSVAVLGALPLSTEGQPPTPTEMQTASVDAASLYQGACSTCHGRSGDGNGPGAAALGSPQPRDFTAGVFKFRSTPTGSLPTDDDIYRTISRGVPGTWMPRWEDLLTPAQRRALVRYIKDFSQLFAEEEPDPPVEIPPEPTVTRALIQEGRFVYATLKCSQCHGPRGRGNGPSADELTDDWDRKITPYDFTHGGYKSGSAPSDIYRTISTGLSGSPMPAFERGIVAFPGGRDVEVAPMAATLDPSPPQVRELAAYLAGQPTRAALDAMPEAELDRLVQHRLWALIYFLRSLDRAKGPFYWLFGENPELQTRGGNP